VIGASPDALSGAGVESMQAKRDGMFSKKKEEIAEEVKGSKKIETKKNAAASKSGQSFSQRSMKKRMKTKNKYVTKKPGIQEDHYQEAGDPKASFSVI
jgi:hypothetical protein